jgi:hypothetical protein
MSIKQFKNLYAGEEIYVFGSGASLDYFNPSYFDSKICIATNRVGFEYGLKYYWVSGHHYEGGEYYRTLGCTAPMILPDRDINNLSMNPIDDNDGVFRFPASQQHYENFSVDEHFPKEDDRLVVGSTGFHTSLHLAQYMGAATIIIVGLDQGLLDGETNFKKYKDRPHLPDRIEPGITEHSFSVWELHTRDMVNKIRSLGCNVFSLNPFMNWNLEGHHFSGYRI